MRVPELSTLYPNAAFSPGFKVKLATHRFYTSNEIAQLPITVFHDKYSL